MFPVLDRWGRFRDASKAVQPRAVADAIRQRAAVGIRTAGHRLRARAAVSMVSPGGLVGRHATRRGMYRPHSVAVSPLRTPGQHGQGQVATLRKDDPWI